MAEHDQSFLGPKIEMAEPKLLVDLRNELVNFWQTVVRHLEIEGASQMQHLEIVPPIEREVIVRPAPRHDQRNFVIGSAITRPAVGMCYLFDDIDWIAHALIACFRRCHSQPSPL